MEHDLVSEYLVSEGVINEQLETNIKKVQFQLCDHDTIFMKLPFVEDSEIQNITNANTYDITLTRVEDSWQYTMRDLNNERTQAGPFENLLAQIKEKQFEAPVNVERIDEIQEKSYKNICHFEKTFYEDITEKDDGTIEFKREHENDTKIDFQTFNSYKELFESEYKELFLVNVEVLDFNDLNNHFQDNTLSVVSDSDLMVRSRMKDITKERDLDGDGVPDRIDINDNNVAVQTVGDLDLVKNSSSKEVEKEREKEHSVSRTKNNELEL